MLSDWVNFPLTYRYIPYLELSAFIVNVMKAVFINDSMVVLLLILATNGVVLATEKKQKSILYDDSSIHKIELITKNIGMVYSGMGPDYR